MKTIYLNTSYLQAGVWVAKMVVERVALDLPPPHHTETLQYCFKSAFSYGTTPAGCNAGTNHRRLLPSQHSLTQLSHSPQIPSEEWTLSPGREKQPLKKTQQDFTLQNENFHCFILDCSCLQKYSCEYTNVPIEAKYFYFLIFNKLSQDS